MVQKGLTTGSFSPDEIGYTEISFSEHEYQSRQQALRQLMARDQIDLLYITNPDMICYLHGFRTGWYKANSPIRYPQIYGTVISQHSDHMLHFDNPTEAPVLAMTSVCKDNRYFSSREAKPNIQFVMDELKKLGWLNGKVGMEFQCYLPNRVVSEQIEQAFIEHNTHVVDASVMIRETRQVKSPAELKYIEKAVRLCELGHNTIRKKARIGMTELQLFGEVIRSMADEGGELAALIPIFTVSPYRNGQMVAIGHSLPSNRKIEIDTILTADLCGVVHRYHGNIMQGHYMGKPPSSLIERYQRAAGVYDVFESECKAGMTVREVNKILRRYYQDAGLENEPGWALGYELGLSLPPDWVGDFYFNINDDKYLDRVFKADMITNFESLFNTSLIETLHWQNSGVRRLSSEKPGLSVISI